MSAVFITIPYPVLGGAALVMFSTFLGVVLSNLQVRVKHCAEITIIDNNLNPFRPADQNIIFANSVDLDETAYQDLQYLPLYFDF